MLVRLVPSLAFGLVLAVVAWLAARQQPVCGQALGSYLVAGGVGYCVWLVLYLVPVARRRIREMRGRHA